MLMDRSRVYDNNFPHVYGTITKVGPEVSEIQWDQPEPWGKNSNTSNKYLRLVKNELDIPGFLKTRNRKPLTKEQQSKLATINVQQAVDEKRDRSLPRNIEPAGLEILEDSKRAKGVLPSDKPRDEHFQLIEPKVKEPKGPGVIATVIATITRPQGASIAEIVSALKTTFPARQEKSMTSTAKIQAKKNATDTKNDPKRGKVFYRGVKT